MPSDTYTLVITDTGVAIPTDHASTHLIGGTDALPVASALTSGLMSTTIFNQHAANTATLSGGITATHLIGGAAGTVPYQTASGSTAMLAAGSAGQVLTSNGSAAPSWAAVNLASSSVTGTLPVSKGGTGAATFLGGLVEANGTSAFTTVTKPSGDIVGTAETQTLTNKTMGSGTTFSSPISVANGGTGVGTFSAGILRSTGGTTTLSTVTQPAGDLVGTTATQTLTNKTFSTGTVLGTPDSGTLTNCSGLPLPGGVTGTLTAAKGGTGHASYTVGDIVYADTATTLAKLASAATGNVLLSGGSSTAPSYGKVGLTTHVSGILPIAYGGTGYGSDGIGTLSFDTTPDTSSALTEGQLRWNATDKTLDLRMAGSSVTQQVGQEVLMRVHASATISNGDVVYISGSNGGLPSISLASNDSVNANKTLGMATEDIASGSDGYVTLMGLVRSLDLAAYSAGDELWLGTTGSFTDTEPSYPAVKVRVGYVVNATDGTGSLYFAPKFYENGTVNGTGKLGYLTGSGGTVTQATSKSTGVTLNTTNGQITMDNASLSGGAVAIFTLTNSKIEAGDVLVLNHISGGTLGTYAMNARAASGSASISLSNLTNGALAEAVVIAFAVIKAVTS